MKTLCLLGLITFSLSASAVDVSLNPLFTYGNYQRFDEVTNLSESDSDRVEVSADSVRGYDLLSTRKIYVSAGVQGTSSISLPGGVFGYVGLGLYPSLNSFAKHIRHFEDRSSLENFSFDIPRTAESLSSLRTGDAVYWNTQGGITLNMNVGIGPAGIGPKVSIEGGHSIYVEKKSETEIYVEVRRISTKTWGIVSGAFIAYAEAGRLVEKSKGFSFLFDVSGPEGQKLYETLLKGRVDTIQESGAAQARIGDVEALKVLGSRKFVAGLPFIPVLELKNESGSEVLTEERSDIWNQQSSVTRALSFRVRSSRVFRKQTLMQTAALVEEKTENGNASTKAQLHWFRKGNRFRPERLELALEKLKSQTGLVDELDVAFPETSAPAGYAKVEFILELSPLLQRTLFSGVSAPKAQAALLQKFWAGKTAFQKIISALKMCGGSWQLEISGEEIHRTMKRESYDSPTSCQLSL